MTEIGFVHCNHANIDVSLLCIVGYGVLARSGVIRLVRGSSVLLLLKRSSGAKHTWYVRTCLAWRETHQIKANDSLKDEISLSSVLTYAILCTLFGSQLWNLTWCPVYKKPFYQNDVNISITKGSLCFWYLNRHFHYNGKKGENLTHCGRRFANIHSLCHKIVVFFWLDTPAAM